MLREHAVCDYGRERRKARASRAWHAPPRCRSVPAAAVERAAVAQGARYTLAQLSRVLSVARRRGLHSVDCRHGGATRGAAATHAGPGASSKHGW